MMGLIIKDVLNLKKSLKTVIAMFLFYIIFAYKTDGPSTLIAMIVMLLSMMSVTSMSYDELSKWDNYALAMPISRKKIVISKYILSLSLSTVGVLVSTMIAYVITLLKGNMSISELLLTSYLVYLISIVFMCIVHPIIYKFGVENSRLMMMTVIAIPVAIAYFLNEMGIPMPNEAQRLLLLRVSPILVALFLLVSISISYGIYKKKDI